MDADLDAPRQLVTQLLRHECETVARLFQHFGIEHPGIPQIHILRERLVEPDGEPLPFRYGALDNAAAEALIATDDIVPSLLEKDQLTLVGTQPRADMLGPEERKPHRPLCLNAIAPVMLDCRP
ncbi:MAG TPA: hypothetical protein DEF41_04050 [Desulfovibrio sp.]|nr:hypothetical protein [Desulfovibrio sp.]